MSCEAAPSLARTPRTHRAPRSIVTSRSSAQAILYVLCYHMEGIIVEGRAAGSQPSAPPRPAQQGQGPAQQQQALDASLSRAVEALVREQVWALLSSSMAPLEVCLPSVVNEFAHQVRAAPCLLTRTPPANRRP